MAVDAILSRLEKVRSIGPMKWQARCPAHDDKTPSLAVKELGDGRILIHCFSGCGAASVMETLGLTLADLMPPPEEHHYAPIRKPWTGDDALRCISSALVVVAIATADAVEQKPLSEADLKTLCEAASRIERALGHVDGLGR